MADLENDTAPNDSEALGVYVPETETEETPEERDEKHKMSSSSPIIQEILTWFEDTAANADTISALRVTMKEFKDLKLTAEQVLVAHHLLVSLLDTQKEDFRARFENFIQSDEDDQDEDISDV